MRDFTKRTNPRRQTLHFFTGIAGLMVLAFVAYGAAHAAWGMYGKFAEAAQSNDDAQQNVTELKAQEAQVSATVDALSTERGQEAQIRQAYGVVLPGEGEIQIVRVAASTTPQAPPQPGLLQKVFKALFVW